MATRRALFALVLGVSALWSTDVAAQNCGPTGNRYSVEITEPSPGVYRDVCKQRPVRVFKARRAGRIVLQLKDSTTAGGLRLQVANFRCLVPPASTAPTCPITNPGCGEAQPLVTGRTIVLDIDRSASKACGNTGHDLFTFDLIVETSSGTRTVVDPQLEIDRDGRQWADYLVPVGFTVGVLLVVAAWWRRRLAVSRPQVR